MAATLSKLPPELLEFVLEDLAKPDLKALSRASKELHAKVAHRLWRRIIIEPESEDNLHCILAKTFRPECVQLARQLHFRSEFDSITKRRCPHEDHMDPGFFDDEYDNEEEYEGEPYFDRLSRQAELLLEQLSDDQLHEFSWDLGTCVPSNVMGPNGIIPLTQPSLRSLSLITDIDCIDSCEPESEICLDPFDQLQSLTWRGLHADNLDTLSTSLRKNATHLQTLELDFVNWTNIWEMLGYYSDDEEDHGITFHNYFVKHLLGVVGRPRKPIFPVLQVLSLSQVPLVPEMARCINFKALESLTLRLCPGWDDFLRRVAKLNLPIKLKTLEIQESATVTKGVGEYSLINVLGSFTGLEELFISLDGPVPSLGLWKHILRRHPTLKRFAYHQMTIDIDDEYPAYEEEYDVSDLTISLQEMRGVVQNPRSNPLSKLDLECLGLACTPGHLRCLLLPFKSKTSLKVIHIRQSAKVLRHHKSMALEDELSEEIPVLGPVLSDTKEPSNPAEGGGTCATNNSDDIDVRGESREGIDNILAQRGLRMTNGFRRFVEWAFGPQGISSLQIIAFGDFAYGGRASHNSIILYRDINCTTGYRVMSEFARNYKEFRDEYRNFLEVCPIGPILGEAYD